MPEWLTEDTAFWYCPKSHATDVTGLEGFVPLSGLLEDSVVTSAYFNVIGVLHGKFVAVIPDVYVPDTGE